MNVGEELVRFLVGIERPVGRPRLDPAQSPAKSPGTEIRKRNRAIILDHFGFGSTFWPTLEQLAHGYEVGTRERVRQIIDAYYTEYLPDGPLPALKAAAEVLSSRHFWVESGFLYDLQSAGLIGSIDHAVGLISYMKTQGLALNYDVYLPDLRSVTRGTYFGHEDRVIVRPDRIKNLKKDLREAERIPGQNGLAEMRFVRKRRPDADLTTLRALIRYNTHAWSKSRGKEFWYAYDRENVLVNLAEKTFQLTETCDLGALSETLQNALTRRASQYEYPDVTLVRDWILGSGHFRVAGESASFLGEPSQLSDIEQMVVDVMSGRGPLPSTVVSRELEARGVGKPSVQKNVFTSPLVWVDKSSGRGKYTFTLVSDLDRELTETVDPFLEDIRERLRRIEETDSDAIAVGRREQSILREWVFRGAPVGECAVCGRTFSEGALVVAHKKRRPLQ